MPDARSGHASAPVATAETAPSEHRNAHRKLADMEFDIAVIGGGAGGLGAARAAARRGARVALVQDGPPGGDCTFTGCVPSKALLSAGERGLEFSTAMQEVHRAIATIASAESPDILEREGIRFIRGRAGLRGTTSFDVDDNHYRANQLVLATGAAPMIPPIGGLDTVEYLTNETVFSLRERPRSLVVLGGGPIGCELALAFARFGTAVTLVEGLDRILPREEPEASDVTAVGLEARGVRVLAGSNVASVGHGEGRRGVRLGIAGGREVTAEQLLVAVGRRPVTAGLDLERAGVQQDARGFIATDATLRTNVGNIWAVGDVTGRMQFTHAADEMGRIAVSNALGRGPRRKFRSEAIPWVTFTDPEVARVGLAEADAPSGARVAWLPMSAFDRAIASGATEGFVKLIVGPHAVTRNLGGGRVLGATIVAARAGEMIHEVALAVRTGMFAGRLAQTVHAYPTWSVAVRQAAAQFFFEVDGRRARAAQRS